MALPLLPARRRAVPLGAAGRLPPRRPRAKQASARQRGAAPCAPPGCTASPTTAAPGPRSAAAAGRSAPASSLPQRAPATAPVPAPAGRAAGRAAATTPPAALRRSAAPAAAAPAACPQSQPNPAFARGSERGAARRRAPAAALTTGTAPGTASAASPAAAWPAPPRTQQSPVCAPWCCGAPWGPARSCATPTATALGRGSAAPPAAATSANRPPRLGLGSVPPQPPVSEQASASSCAWRTRTAPPARSAACGTAAGRASPRCRAQPSPGWGGQHRELPFRSRSHPVPSQLRDEPEVRGEAPHPAPAAPAQPVRGAGAPALLGSTETE